MKIHPDFGDLNQNSVEYVIISSFALAFHGQPRATGDIDFWVRSTSENAKKLLNALNYFSFSSIEISVDDILSGKIIQLGYPPVRIDIVTVLSGLEQEEIMHSRISGKFGEHQVFYLSKEAFIKNKRKVGRYKDLADLELLGE